MNLQQVKEYSERFYNIFTEIALLKQDLKILADEVKDLNLDIDVGSLKKHAELKASGAYLKTIAKVDAIKEIDEMLSK